MKTLLRITITFLFSTLPLFAQTSEQPGDEGWVALGKVDFLVGNWEGEGWSLNPSGERDKFLIKESYVYRGARALVDMEGRFRDVQPDGSYRRRKTMRLEFCSTMRRAADMIKREFVEKGENIRI